MKILLSEVSTQEDRETFLMMMHRQDPNDRGCTDDFFCLGKFKACSIEDARKQLAEVADKLPDAGSGYKYYVSDYNEMMDDGGKVFDNLQSLVSRFIIASTCPSSRQFRRTQRKRTW